MKNVRKFKTLNAYIFLALFILLLYAGWRFTIHHFNIYPYCNVTLTRDVLSDDRNALKRAITTLKSVDVEGYKNFCTYVDTVVEQYCKNGDSRGDPSFVEVVPQGCYVRGTHTIYLTPTRFIKGQRDPKVNIIRSLSEESKNFWENR
jgi:hypothetical protein